MQGLGDVHLVTRGELSDYLSATSAAAAFALPAAASDLFALPAAAPISSQYGVKAAIAAGVDCDGIRLEEDVVNG
jgi:hypothetical protein